jgi:hypothetical protein
MAGFFNLKNNSLADQKKTGEAIIKVSESVFDNSTDSEWRKFNADTRGWLHKKGYRYEGPGAGPNGEIPATIEIVPVYDTPNRMHVRVPWAGDLKPTPVVEDELTYGDTDEVRFKVLLARYFMRKCR